MKNDFTLIESFPELGLIRVSKLYKFLEFGTHSFYFTIGKYCRIAINQETLIYVNRISGRLIKGLEVWVGRLLSSFNAKRCFFLVKKFKEANLRDKERNFSFFWSSLTKFEHKQAKRVALASNFMYL